MTEFGYKTDTWVPGKSILLYKFTLFSWIFQGKRAFYVRWNIYHGQNLGKEHMELKTETFWLQKQKIHASVSKGKVKFEENML